MGTLVSVGTTDIRVLSTTFGSVVNHTCIEGYRLRGEFQRICLSNGEWSGPLPTCDRKSYQHVDASKQCVKCAFINFYIAISCGDPGTPRNGSTTVTSDTVGSIAEHFCDEGFNLEGVSQRECLANGSWSDSLPTCVRK